MNNTQDKAPPTGPAEGFGGWGPVFREVLPLIIPDGATILELGSGLGTRWLCERWKVRSVEHNPAWLGIAGNSEYFHAPIKRGWFSVDQVKAAIGDGYDLLIIDGPPGRIGRAGLLANIDLFDLSKPIIVDDTHRQEEVALSKQISAKAGRDIQRYMDDRKKFDVI